MQRVIFPTASSSAEYKKESSFYVDEKKVSGWSERAFLQW